MDKNVISEKKLTRKDVICASYKSFADFLSDNFYSIYRYWIYRRGFTPYEQDKKFSDETMFEDVYCNKAYITECIDLPDGDILLGLLDAEAIDENGRIYIQYCKLSEIRLEYCEADNAEDNEE